MKIQISDQFTFKKLLRFSLPAIIMMIFTSIYGVVDGFFVSNFVGKTPFAAVNFIMPFLMILGCIGFMFGTGGSALISKTMGEGKPDKANHIFSLLVYVALILGIILAILGIAFVRPIASLLGAEGVLLDKCALYAKVVLLALPAFILQYAFQSFFVTAEKPQIGLYVTLCAGITNIILDALFVAGFRWGLVGAAAATALSQCVGGIIPILYFSRKNTSSLRLGKTTFDGRTLIKTFTNGSSELLSNISMSLVSMLYNMQLMKYAGENGVAAYGVLMYVNMIFIASFIGYSVGTAPIISYHYGAGHPKEISGILKKSFIIIGIFSVGMFILGESLARPLSMIFVHYDKELFQLTIRAFFFFSFSFLFSGIAIYSSSFFTALNNGLISALISFLRTLVFQIAAVLILPYFLKIDGIWMSIIVAEIMAAMLSILFIFFYRKKYQY